MSLLAAIAFASAAAWASPDAEEVRFDHELTLYAIPAPKPLGLTWRRPGPLTRRTLINEGLDLDRGIGHAGVRVECSATTDRPAAHYQGSMRSTGDEFRTMVLGEKAGLGVLFRTVPGRLEEEEELQQTLDQRTDKGGRLSWLRVGISAETCHGLLDFVEEYREAHVGDHYGFVRPLYYEGAGCSAFSMAFLELAGLTEPWMREEWIFDVRIPDRLIGGETRPGNRVGVLKLMTISGRWAEEDEPHMRLSGWDPTLMFHSLRDRAEAALEDGSVPAEHEGKAVGLVVDRRDVPPSEALRSGVFFSGEPEMESDERFLTAP